MRLLIIGTGGMARQHAEHFSRIEGVEVVGGVDVDADRLQVFADKHRIAKRFTSLDAALDWGDFDAVSNVTPDRAHHPTTLPCIAAGKHVLCEKPLATSHALALEMTEAAEAAGVVAMVNLTYRNVAQIHKAREMIAAGQIGQVKHVEASYLQSWLVQPAWGKWDVDTQWLWRLSTAHGSNGVLGDIGVHILDFVSFAAGLDIAQVYCRLQTFSKVPGDRIGEYLLDANDSFAMSVAFGNGAIGVVHASRWAAGHLNELRVRIYGDKGGLEVTHRTDGSGLRACVGDDALTATWREVVAEPVSTNYMRFVAAVRQGETAEPSFRHATKLQKVLDLAEHAHSTRHDQSLLS